MDNDNDDISFELTGHIELDEADIRSFEKLVRSVLRTASADKTHVSVAITDDEGITQVHERFLNSSDTTDVISFDLSDDDDDCRTFDIVVNYDQAKRQAEIRGHGVIAELALYITHGMLHNLGYDDIEEDDAKIMHEKEDEILSDAGFGKIFGGKDFKN